MTTLTLWPLLSSARVISAQFSHLTFASAHLSPIRFFRRRQHCSLQCHKGSIDFQMLSYSSASLVCGIGWLMNWLFGFMRQKGCRVLEEGVGGWGGFCKRKKARLLGNWISSLKSVRWLTLIGMWLAVLLLDVMIRWFPECAYSFADTLAAITAGLMFLHWTEMSCRQALLTFPLPLHSSFFSLSFYILLLFLINAFTCYLSFLHHSGVSPTEPSPHASYKNSFFEAGRVVSSLPILPHPSLAKLTIF